MPQVDPTHQHWASQIITDNTHTPIAPGGAVSVTDGTTTVAAASQIVMPAGTVSDLGNGSAAVGLVFRRVGPFRINFDTPDFISPAVDNGPVLFAAPAGSLVLCIPISVSIWDHPIDVMFSIGETGQLLSAGNGVFASTSVTAPGAADQLFHPPVFQQDGGCQWALATSACDVAVAGYPTGEAPQNPTTGAFDVYAIIATPAA